MLHAVFLLPVASYMDMSDMEQLIDDAQGGDKMAQTLLYKRCRSRVVATCRHIVKDPLLAEELADDAFVIAFAKIGQLQDAARYESWVCQIARRLAIRHLRRQRQLVLLPLEEVAEMPAAEQSDISEEEILQAVATLPAGYREVFRLSVLEGKSHQEIANQLGIAPHSSSSQLTRAKRMLRTMLRFVWTLLVVPVVWLLLHQKDEKPPLVASETVVDTILPILEREQGIPQRLSGFSTDSSAVALVPPIEQLPVELLRQDTAVVRPQVREDMWDSVSILAEPWMKGSVPEDSRWSFTVAYTQPTTGANNFTQPHALLLSDGVAINNWSEYAMLEHTGLSTLSTLEDILMGKIAMSNIDNNGGVISRSENHLPPVEVNGMLSKNIGNGWTVGAGLGLMSLNSHFRFGEGLNRLEQEQTLFYLGIHTSVTWQVWRYEPISVSVSAGAVLHLPLHASIATDYIVNQNVELHKRVALRNSVMGSVGAGISLQWHLSPAFSLYVEPSLRYYRLPAETPATFLSQHPVSFSLPCGLRINF